MQSPTSRVLSAGLLLALLAGPAEAQQLAGSFDQLQVLVKTGDTVRVTDSRGEEVRGSIADLSSSSLALKVGGSRRTFLEGDIASIHQRRNDSLANGAKWGFAVGAGLGVLGGITIASEYGSGGAAFIPILGMVYGAIGAGAGAGIDAMHRSEQVIYGRRGAPSKLTLHPILTADRKGVLASLRFNGW
jgi:hypothetical protein